jgi:hypothetical protein
MKNFLLVIMLTQLAACMPISDKPSRSARNSIEQQVPNIRLEKEFAISLGNSMLSFLDVVNLIEADISELDYVQVAIYNVESGGEEIDFNRIDFPTRCAAEERIFIGKRYSRCVKGENKSGY